MPLHCCPQLIRDDLRASTGGGGEGSEWWRGAEEGTGGGEGEESQEEARMDNLENYVELLYEGKDKVRARDRRAPIGYNGLRYSSVSLSRVLPVFNCWLKPWGEQQQAINSLRVNSSKRKRTGPRATSKY